MNPKFKVRKTNRVDKKYEAFVREKKCVLCGQRSVVHHCYHRNDSYGSINLCCGHHTDRMDSYHRLGSREKFEEAHNINIDWVIYELLSEYIESINND